MEINREKVFELCAETLDIPAEVVEHVWKSQYKFIREWMNNTEDAAIQLPSFGTFRINQQYIDREIERTITKLRHKRTSKQEKRLKELLRLKNII